MEKESEAENVCPAIFIYTGNDIYVGQKEITFIYTHAQQVVSSVIRGNHEIVHSWSLLLFTQIPFERQTNRLLSQAPSVYSVWLSSRCTVLYGDFIRPIIHLFLFRSISTEVVTKNLHNYCWNCTAFTCLHTVSFFVPGPVHVLWCAVTWIRYWINNDCINTHRGFIIILWSFPDLLALQNLLFMKLAFCIAHYSMCRNGGCVCIRSIWVLIVCRTPRGIYRNLFIYLELTISTHAVNNNQIASKCIQFDL